MDDQIIGRRRFLALGAATLSAIAASTLLPGAPSPSGGRLQAADAIPTARWSQPSSWANGAVPSPGTIAVVDRPVLLDVDVDVNGVDILATGALVFDPGASRTLASRGNVVVRGLLQMRPASASQVHTLRFVGVDESRFVGGGMSVLPTDVGLWCMEAGRLDLAGTPKTAWVRTSGSVAAGATQLQLQAPPTGWNVGDEIAITPTVGPDVSDHSLRYDYATITSVSGSTVTLSRATSNPHPAATVGGVMLLAPEVMNLTRNVRIEGTATGRAHIFLMPTVPQRMSYFAARWLGPRKAADGYTGSVLGRYGLHFHMGYEGTRGTEVTGVVVRDTGGHAFVPHASHGITFTSCISHDTFDEAYWWDGAPDTRTPAPDTNAAVYNACIASLVRCDPPFRGFRLAGFSLGTGAGNRIRDCVAVGVQGSTTSAGFLWPEGPTSGVWDFLNCVSHNNRINGIFTWQNTLRHVVRDFVCYHNGSAGMSHGAYLTSYHYVNGYLHHNGRTGLELHSNARPELPQRFERITIESRAGTQHAVSILKHTLDPCLPTEFVRCLFTGQAAAAIAVTYDGSNGPTTTEWHDVIECVSSTPLLWLRDDTVPGSRIRVQNGGTAVVATPRGSAGTFNPLWNAVTNSIPAFVAEAAGAGTTPFSPLAAAPVLPVVLASPLPVPVPAPAPAPTTVAQTPTSTIADTGHGKPAKATKPAKRTGVVP